MRQTFYHSLINSWRLFLVSLYSFNCSININHYTIDKKTCDSRALPNLSPIVPPQEAPSHTSTEATKKKKGFSASGSEYEKRQQANIEQNKKLLASLGLGEGVGILGESLSEKKKK